ncbi:MAG: hypothetical protein JW704_09045 [Anaerolineaceae bacterium]|nr:hypothetical protein [Anaerolineaceae bacterium]MBN2677084.1 hypothetical protein [Anaerolineaceae bacterium]
MTPLVTIFSTPKPFINAQITRIQNNAFNSWIRLGPEADVLLVGQEEGVEEAARKAGIRLIKKVERNAQGTPLIMSIFQAARDNSSSPLLAYVNADIILEPKFLEVARQVKSQAATFLVVGRRWDLDIQHELDFSEGWVDRLKCMVDKNARLHPTGGSDYFIFPRSCFQRIPALVIGRAGWDNWMIYNARICNWPVVDATLTYQVVHQQHDYAHLPEGKPHYRLPESDENIRQAGGRHAIYTLVDANWLLKEGRLFKAPLTLKRLWREIEIFPATTLKRPWLAELAYYTLHPLRAYWELRVRLSKIRKGRS